MQYLWEETKSIQTMDVFNRTFIVILVFIASLTFLLLKFFHLLVHLTSNSTVVENKRLILNPNT